MRRTLPIVLTGERLPPRLRDLPRPPEALFVRGELPRGPAVAIVGTREPTVEAATFAEQLARELALAGVAIFSGGAKGIDTAAHRGALEAGGVTVVVAPAGYDAPFPEENAELFRRIVAERGAYVSLVPDDVAATQPAFFRRNACLAALAHAVVVVQAPRRSGARNAAAWARRLGRPLLVVPSAPWIERGLGCLLELRRGAQLCESARNVLQVLEQLGVTPPAPPRRDKRSRRRPRGRRRDDAAARRQGVLFHSPSVSDALRLDPADRAVLDAVRDGVSRPDDLCVRLGLPAARIQQAILTLRLSGALVADPAGGVSLPSHGKY